MDYKADPHPEHTKKVLNLMCDLAKANEEITALRHSERVATAAVVYLAGRIATANKLSTIWIQEALEAAEKTIKGGE